MPITVWWYTIEERGGKFDAVALSVPRPGIDDPQKVSCSTIVVPLIGHKDDKIALPVAEELAKKYDCPVVVVAGIHIKNAGAGEIDKLVSNCWKAVKMLVGERYSLA